MPLRLTAAAVVSLFFLLAGLALGQTPVPSADRPSQPDATPEELRDRIQERERTGMDPNLASGSFGTTRRGDAHGPADSAPAPGPGGRRDTASEPSGPASAERRPGDATAQ